MTRQADITKLEEHLAALEQAVASIQQQLEALGQTEGKLEELVALLKQEADALGQAGCQIECWLKAVEHELIENRTEHEDF